MNIQNLFKEDKKKDDVPYYETAEFWYWVIFIILLKKLKIETIKYIWESSEKGN